MKQNDRRDVAHTRRHMPQGDVLLLVQNHNDTIRPPFGRRDQQQQGRRGERIMLEVYLDPATINSRKVLAGLELLGVPYELKHVNYFAGAHKQPEYLSLNPNGSLPTAKDGDYTLW
jgi:hypothetical protein